MLEQPVDDRVGPREQPQLHAVAVLDDRAQHPPHRGEAVDHRHLGRAAGEASICSASARAAAAWPSPTSAERIENATRPVLLAEPAAGCVCVLVRRITGISTPAPWGLQRAGARLRPRRPRLRGCALQRTWAAWMPAGRGAVRMGSMQATRRAATAARAAARRPERGPRRARRAPRTRRASGCGAAAAGLLRAARRVAGSCSCVDAAAAPSRYVPADSGGWPGWLSGPLAGARLAPRQRRLPDADAGHLRELPGGAGGAARAAARGAGGGRRGGPRDPRCSGRR